MLPCTFREQFASNWSGNRILGETAIVRRCSGLLFISRRIFKGVGDMSLAELIEFAIRISAIIRNLNSLALSGTS